MDLTLHFARTIEVDPEVYNSKDRGIIAGVGILTFFIFFPAGEPFDFKEERIKERNERVNLREEKQRERERERLQSAKIARASEKKAVDIDDKGRQNEYKPIDEKEGKDFSNVKPRKSTGMCNRDDDIDNDGQKMQLDWWITILNLTLYGSLIVIAGFVLNVSYGIDVRSHARLFIKYYLPKEAAIFGL